MDWFRYDNGPRHERVKRDKLFTIHQTNIQSLAIELLKETFFKQYNVRHFLS